MGTSIHMHVEVRKADTWHHFAAPAMFRDAGFFDLVAGVYGNLKPVVRPRGLPEDLSFTTRLCHGQDKENYGLHHEGWLGADELAELQVRLNGLYKDSGKRHLEYDLEAAYLHTYINGNAVASHQGWDDVRLVFWFDN